MAPDAHIDEGAHIEGPCFIDEGVTVRAGARILPYTVLGRQCQIEEDASVDASIVWADTRIGRDAVVKDAIVGRHCLIGRSATVSSDAVLGDKSVVTDYSKA